MTAIDIEAALAAQAKPDERIEYFDTSRCCREIEAMARQCVPDGDGWYVHAIETHIYPGGIGGRAVFWRVVKVA